jgi:hypothetical protein
MRGTIEFARAIHLKEMEYKEVVGNLAKIAIGVVQFGQ